MRKLNSLLFTATFLASFLLNLGMGINSKQLISSAIAETNNSQSSQMQPLEFTDENIKFTLLAPQGAKVIKESWGTIKIQAGNNFAIELIIADETVFGSDTVAQFKKDIQANDVNILKRIITETPTSILYESSVEPTKPEFHLYVYKELDDSRLTCENTKGQTFSQFEAELMWQSCNSIAKKK